MKQMVLKNLFINWLIRLRIYQKRKVMLQFVRRNWFYIGLVLLAAIYFRKDLLTIMHTGSDKTTEKYSAKEPEGGESLFSVGSTGSLTPGGTLPDIPEATAKSFLRRFAKVVQGEQKKYHIPSSALLALAYVNSHAGTRALAEEANNFLALACGENWDGPTAEIGSFCFRRYETAWMCYRDGSEQLSATRWAQKLITSNEKDPGKWVEAFVANNYSDISNADQEMKKVIKSYRLFELDQ
jgi:Mannosyl-glycoprotein endo-beta-N-acetylglucosaminidase